MKFAAVVFLFLVAVSSANARAQTKPSSQQPEKSDDVIKITTNLVQVDAVVTDKHGRPVTNLKPADFELLENGHPRQITEFSYISLTEPPATVDAQFSDKRTGVDQRSRPPLTLHAIRPEQVRRVIAIVVDDVGLSAESTSRLRNALERFVQQHTQSTDLMAVIRASGGAGAMQQFTSNRTQVLSTIKRLNWYRNGRGGMSPNESLNPLDHDGDGLELKGYRGNRPSDLSGKEFFGGSLGALSFVIQGLSSFPGRKSLVLISDNLPATTREAIAAGATRALDRMIEQANQHSIVISTIDARGMQKAGLTADDSQYNLAANQLSRRIPDRRIKFNVQLDSLNYLAEETGGIFIHSNNDLTDALRKVADGEQGYYLIGYRPDDLDDDKTPARTRGYKVKLRVKDASFEVRTRSGFHRVSVPRVETKVPAKEELLRAALVSPFVQEDVRLEMTALFTGSSQVRILLHVNARDIELTKAPDDVYSGSFDVVAVAFDDKGKIAQQIARTQTLRVPSENHERMLRDGIVYSLTVPMQTPGPYQFRLAVRDSGSGRIGSDSQFVELPDPKKTRLSVSGFVIQHAEPDTAKQHALATSNAPFPQIGIDGTRRGPAVRRFDAGDLLTYSYLIYGARRDKSSNGPKLTGQIRLFRADAEVFTGREMPVTVLESSRDGGIVGQGNLTLGKGLPPGDYFLQVVVIDKLASADRQLAEQWIDVEIVK
ncbi:MAG TPA: VWA domain-containing protein [Pyrinomonadaceae bacterium]|nr:VWA domain-containing protein [Pyrinomonadaceae bacterium]